MPTTETRLTTPDVARGYMLLLIALANVAAWAPAARVAGPDASGLDQVWVMGRTMFIDGRSYPLFSMLFGFGLAMIAARYADPRQGADLLRRRGWLLLAFGGVHGLLFPGDILGAYGLTAVLLAPLIAYGRRSGLTIVAVAVTIVAMAATMTPADGSSQGSPEFEPRILYNLVAWVSVTLFTLPMSVVVPSVAIGVYVYRSGVLAHPERHRRRLAVVAVAGLAAGAVTAVPLGLERINASRIVGADALDMLGGVAGALGWLALIAWACAGRPTASPRSPLVAVGRRSMTAYLCQSIVFAITFAVIGANGAESSISAVGAAGIAVATWTLIAVACTALAHVGAPGPAEALIRRLLHGKREKPAVTDASDAAASSPRRAADPDTR